MYVAIVIVAELMIVIVIGYMCTYFRRSQDREDETKSIIVGLCVSSPILAIIGVGISACHNTLVDYV